jgi:hypothetical protein
MKKSSRSLNHCFDLASPNIPEFFYENGFCLRFSLCRADFVNALNGSNGNLRAILNQVQLNGHVSARKCTD